MQYVNVAVSSCLGFYIFQNLLLHIYRHWYDIIKYVRFERRYIGHVIHTFICCWFNSIFPFSKHYILPQLEHSFIILLKRVVITRHPQPCSSIFLSSYFQFWEKKGQIDITHTHTHTQPWLVLQPMNLTGPFDCLTGKLVHSQSSCLALPSEIGW